MTAPEQTRNGEAGFSLIETMIAMSILATGLLSLAGVFIMGLTHLNGSSASLIAREKAREAVESVHTARDNESLSWCQVRNSDVPANCPNNANGVFLPGLQPMYLPGKDGLVNTADDATAGYEMAVTPGNDGILGTADDKKVPLTNYKRQIEITDVVVAGVTNPNLRQLKVTIEYTVGTLKRTYVLTTYISAIS
jgi:prepilin-type N-terminal cleavage/methylation domain-containing protein